jgi:glycerol-3-phosphate acyltransferase PlsY
MTFAALYVASYLVGAIPFGVLIARLGGVDILKTGSGNPGATNVYRTLGWRYGLPVFLLDVAKGYAPAAVALWVTGSKEQAFLCGLLAIAGHSLSPFLRFRGGKGVATGLGALLGSMPLVGLSALGCFVVVFLIGRYVSLASIVAAASMAAFGFLYEEPLTLRAALVLLALFVILRHGANIRRLLAGEEPKFRLGRRSERPT